MVVGKIARRLHLLVHLAAVKHTPQQEEFNGEQVSVNVEDGCYAIRTPRPSSMNLSVAVMRVAVETGGKRVKWAIENGEGFFIYRWWPGQEIGHAS